MLSLSATSFMLKRQENNISLIVISILKQNFESVCKTLQKVESYWSTIQNGAHWLRLRFGASISCGVLWLIKDLLYIKRWTQLDFHIIRLL